MQFNETFKIHANCQVFFLFLSRFALLLLLRMKIIVMTVCVRVNDARQSIIKHFLSFVIQAVSYVVRLEFKVCCEIEKV